MAKAARPSAPFCFALIAWLTAVTVGLGLLLSSGSDELFRDTDDYMRAVQVQDWLDGAGWHDVRQPRLDPPGGVDMHWSRLPDLPLAGVTAVLTPALGPSDALLTAAAIVPMALLLVLLLAAGWAARPLLRRGDAPALYLSLVLALPVTTQFLPGRIDHHNWQLILGILLLGCLLRLLLRPQAWSPAAAGGVAAAVSMWIGVEALPWIGAFCLVLGLRWVARGDRAIDAGLAFALSLFAASLALLPIAVPPARMAAVACDAFSLAAVGLSGAILLTWAALRLAADRLRSPAARLVAAGASAAAGLGLFLILFPECRAGPMGGIDPMLVEVWLSRVSEARSMLELAADKPGGLPLLLAGPAFAIIVAAVQSRRCRGRRRWLWLALLVWTLLALATALWQIRMAKFAGLFSIVALAWITAATWRAAERRWAGWRQSLARLAAVLALGPMPWIGLAALTPAQESHAGEPQAGAETSCDLRAVAPLLAGLPAPAIIASLIDLGPELLFRTEHAVLAGPYHRNVRGNLDSHALFTAADPETARSIVDRRRVDVIVFCPSKSGMRVAADGAAPTFVQQLAAGEAPDWLRPVPVPVGEARLFLVVPQAGG